MGGVNTAGRSITRTSWKWPPGNTISRSCSARAARNFGKVEAPLVIDPWDAKQFGLSGVALSNQVHQMSETTSGLDAALLEDRVPLVTQRAAHHPSGDNRFKNDGAGVGVRGDL